MNDTPDAAPPTDAVPGTDTTGDARPFSYTALHLWLAIAAVTVAAWWGCLIWMVRTTSNPETVNYRQVAFSPVVVTATVLDLAEGRIRVERNWRGAESPEGLEIAISGLDETEAETGGTYVIPLSPKLAGGFGVTDVVVPAMDEGGEPTERPVVYPDTDDVRDQLRRILDDLAKPRDDE